MNPLTLALIALRGTALALSLQGQNKTSDYLYLLADAAESGLDVDAHMALVAEKLKQRSANDEDWSDVTDRIEELSGRLHDNGSG